MAELSEIKRMVLRLSDKEIVSLLGLNNKRPESSNKGSLSKAPNRWYDKEVCGLDREGLAHLNELEQQVKNPLMAKDVDRKLLRYLRLFRRMKMDVPSFYREEINPKQLYQNLKAFCMDHDIPSEIASSVIPAFFSYIETGHMRPIIFTGSKGAGKTTAVRLIVEKMFQLHVEPIKIPQMSGGHGLTGDSGTYRAADVGDIAKARIHSRRLINGYLFDEVDKPPLYGERSNVTDVLLSITDTSNNSIFENYLETNLVGLEYCPMFFTANDIKKVNPILVDRCTVIPFPDPSVRRIKSISRKYAEEKLTNRIYGMIRFDYDLMFKYIERLVELDVTSIRKHQQLIESVLNKALNTALSQEGDTPVEVTETMFAEAEKAVLVSEKRKVGFGR